MRLPHTNFCVAILATVAMACGGAQAPGDAAAEPPFAVDSAAGAATAEPVSAARPAATTASTGTARVRLTGGGVDIDGDYPTTVCGGAFGLGTGVAYQTRAGDWQVTVASAERQAGDVPLNDASGDVNVTVVVNGPGGQLVRGPRNGGSLRISDDFNRAEAELELRHLTGGEPSRLVATFTCEPSA